MRLSLFLAVLCLTLPAVSPEAQPSETTPFLLAVLNRDGLAVPFAAFNGRRWVAPWPQSLRGDIPISLDDVDEDWWGTGARPQKMTLWWNGRRVSDVAFFRSFPCERSARRASGCAPITSRASLRRRA